tara:strand:- start:169 stop:939 length:771 start_codon:yes stop_codon:yes gene_type:complete
MVTMSKDLKYFLNKYKEDTCTLAQVGAHFGQEIPLLVESQINQIYLFEPLEEALEVLDKKIKNNDNITLFPFALGNENSNKEMYYSDNNYGQSSSMLEPNLHKVLQPKIKFQKKITIEVRKLKDLSLENIDFLIMDVQGYELEVLKGFSSKLQDVKYIFTEINRNYLYEDNVLISELDIFLKNNGFIRTWTSWRTADMPWGDALYIKVNKIDIVQRLYLNLKNFLLTNRVYFLLYGLFDYRIYKKRLKNLIFKKSV